MGLVSINNLIWKLYQSQQSLNQRAWNLEANLCNGHPKMILKIFCWMHFFADEDVFYIQIPLLTLSVSVSQLFRLRYNYELATDRKLSCLHYATPASILIHLYLLSYEFKVISWLIGPDIISNKYNCGNVNGDFKEFNFPQIFLNDTSQLAPVL